MSHWVAAFRERLPDPPPDLSFQGLQPDATRILQVIASQVFILSTTMILVNNCALPSIVLDTNRSIASLVGSAPRTVRPRVAGYFLGVGLDAGVVGHTR